jgi:hemerythrin-like domain-containing protein
MKATDELKKEHQGIEVMLRIIGAISDKSARGEEISVQHLFDIMEFLTVFVDKCHHGKEEEFLFPALEAAGIAREGGPVGVMLHEHEQGRKLVAKLKAAVSGLRTADQSAATAIQETGNQYVALLTDHIAKENNMLFKMADERLDGSQDERLVEAFEKLERDRIGVGKHEEFHALLEKLQDVYLK